MTTQIFPKHSKPNLKIKEQASLESSFSTIHDKEFYQDRTLFLQEVLEHASDVLVMTRPPQTGKTTALSMLKGFLEESGSKDNLSIFQKLSIGENAQVMTYQGKHPVIHLSFKKAREESLAMCYQEICKEIRRVYQQHQKLIILHLSDQEKKGYEVFLSHKPFVPEVETHSIKNSLLLLTEYFYRATGKKPYLLIDDYDAPFQSSVQWGFQESIQNFYGAMLNNVLYERSFLGKAVLMGTLPFAPSIESMVDSWNDHNIFTNSFVSSFKVMKEQSNQKRFYPRYFHDWLKMYSFRLHSDLYNLLDGKSIPCSFKSHSMSMEKPTSHQDLLKILLSYGVLKIVSKQRGVSSMCYELEIEDQEANNFLSGIL